MELRQRPASYKKDGTYWVQGRNRHILERDPQPFLDTLADYRTFQDGILDIRDHLRDLIVQTSLPDGITGLARLTYALLPVSIRSAEVEGDAFVALPHFSLATSLGQSTLECSYDAPRFQARASGGLAATVLEQAVPFITERVGGPLDTRTVWFSSERLRPYEKELDLGWIYRLPDVPDALLAPAQPL